MANGSFKIKKSANLDPQTGSVVTAPGDIAYNASTSKLELYDGSVDPIVTEKDTATLTNKTLTGNIAANLISGSGELILNTTGIVTVPNTTDTLVGKATTDTLTNKSIDGATNTITNVSLTAGVTGILPTSEGGTGQNLSAASGALSVAAGVVSASTLPAIDGGTGIASYTVGDVLYANSTTTLAKLAIGTAKQVIQVSGGLPSWQPAASGGINYLSANPDAETDTSGWTTYANSASNIPSNGTGGSPSSTWTRSTVTPLRGAASFLWTKAGAANRQGEGVAYPFTIDKADLAKPLAINCDYSIASGSFTASNGITAPLNDGTTTTNAGNSDLEFFIYDVTNAVLIPVSPQVLSGNQSDSYSFKAIFQTSSNSTSYKLIIHTATATTNNFSLEFDNFYVGPQSVSYGPPVTDWVDYPITFTATTTAPTLGTVQFNEAKWRRVGDSMHIQYNFLQIDASGANAGSGTYLWNLPAGYSIDSSKQLLSSANPTYTLTDTSAGCGTADVTYSGGGYNMIGTALAYDSQHIAAIVSYTGLGQGTGLIGSGVTPLTTASLWGIYLNVVVPIAGWSSTALMSNDTSTRVVASSYTSSTTSIAGGATQTLIFPIKSVDTHSSYNTSTGQYTIPVSGIYDLSLMAYNVVDANSTYVGFIVKNSIIISADQNSSAAAGNRITVKPKVITACVAGDVIEFQVQNGGASTITMTGDVSVLFNIARLSGPSAIAATETIAFKAQDISPSTTFGPANQPIIFTTLGTTGFDSHGAYSTSTGIYTVPSSGTYLVGASAGIAMTVVAGNIIDFYLNKNTVAFARGRYQAQASGAFTFPVSCESLIKLLAGDQLSVGQFVNGASTSFQGSELDNQFYVNRVGN